MPTYFCKLNDGWDADPNVPEPHVQINDVGLTLTFFLHPYSPTKSRDNDRGQISFPNCWRYRLGATNDEGWHRGQCRYRCLAPDWGDFYQVGGNLLEDRPKDWVLMKSTPSDPSHHYLFYFKDETFECDASDWSFRIMRTSDADYERFPVAEGPVTLKPVTLVGCVKDLLRNLFGWAKDAYEKRKAA